MFTSIVMAIAKGPLSVAMPVMAMWFLIPVALGIIFLHEGITVTKMAGIAMAGGAILLLMR